MQFPTFTTGPEGLRPPCRCIVVYPLWTLSREERRLNLSETSHDRVLHPQSHYARCTAATSSPQGETMTFESPPATFVGLDSSMLDQEEQNVHQVAVGLQSCTTCNEGCTAPRMLTSKTAGCNHSDCSRCFPLLKRSEGMRDEGSEERVQAKCGIRRGL